MISNLKTLCTQTHGRYVCLSREIVKLLRAKIMAGLIFVMYVLNVFFF